MPNRIIRDWTDSLTMDSLKFEEEVLFARLIMKADDYGNFHANHKMIKSLCFPLKDTIRLSDIDRWLGSLEAAGLIAKYEVKGTQYLTILNFGQRLRQKRRMFPDPGGESVSDNSSGYVYLIATSDEDLIVKIGYSLNPWARANEISTGNHKKLKVIATFTGSVKEERELQGLLEKFRKNGEWFELPIEIKKFLFDCSETKESAKYINGQLRDNYGLLRSTEKKRREGEEETKGKEKSRQHENAFVVYNAEDEILKNPIEFERLCMNAGLEISAGKDVLRKYHLYKEEKEQYPMGKKAVFAGFEKWLLNEKKFTNGTHQQTFNRSSKPGTPDEQADAADRF